MNDQLERLCKLAIKNAPNNGQNPTAISYFEVLKSTSPTQLQHGILKPSFCVLLQGNKKVLMGSEVLKYGPGNYLASLIDIPVAGQIVGASAKNPYLGLRIEFTNDEIASVLLEANLNLTAQTKVRPGAFTSLASENVLETFIKLFKLLDTPDDIPYLSQLLKKELIYHLLCSEAGHLFAQNMILNPSNLGLGKAINWIKDNFDKAFTIEELAKASNMSVSSLHHKFKAFASMGPLQYQKQLRLQEARRLLMNGDEDDATNVALRVGYESSSQFSREYRRLFGLPPIQDAKTLRKMAKTELDEALVS
jgi:AraC-like DNA-binding protein